MLGMGPLSEYNVTSACAGRIIAIQVMAVAAISMPRKALLGISFFLGAFISYSFCLNRRKYSSAAKDFLVMI